MDHVIETERLPIKIWTDKVEETALVQAKNLATLPFAFKWVALMPDTHCGYGMPIGGVLATENVIIPNAVGVDIGCGMRAVRTNLTDLTREQINRILGGSEEYQGGIRSHIPVGFNHQSKTQEWEGFDSAPDIGSIRQQLQADRSARKQLGTLGGGNHFIEIQKGDDGFIWVMIHSGSRNIGYQIARYYNKVAQRLCRQWYVNIPKFKGEDGLAFLPLQDPAGGEYYKAMKYMCEFARENRRLMMVRIMEAFQAVFDDQVVFDEPLDVHHNYARMEHHYGKNVWVHRKGAISARSGELGIIPGSQGSCSYIVQGLGNPESFNSCSHGAGRKMSRGKACKTLDLVAEIAKMDDQGIVHGLRNIKDLDEAAGAYKDIDVVMAHQKDLVKIVTKLQPLAVVKA